MTPFLNPMDGFRLWLQTALMMGEAQMIIGMRLMGMAGVWRVLPSENARMVTEKSQAAMAAALAGGRALAAGAGPHAVALAAMKPVRAKTRANVARLARRGPKLPE
jgi:hypothetical protein